MTSETEAEMRDALQIEDGFESVRRVKDIVIAVVQGADPSARVVRTDYFNHTYIPDLVVEWPARGTENLRRIYLRSTQDPEQIEIDVKTHGATRPMFVHLSELLPAADTAGLDRLSATARDAHTLVTQVSSFEQLTRLCDRPGARLLPPSVLRGGQGVLGAEQAAVTAHAVNRGFAGAIEADGDTIGSAFEAIDAVLEPSTAIEVKSVLETIWMASNTSSDLVPQQSLWWFPEVTPARLRSLLRAVPADLASFWERLGERVTLESFDGLNILGDDRVALQSIMVTAVANITVRTSRIVDLGDTAAAPEDLMWRVEHGRLSLQGFGHRCWIGRRNDELPPPSRIKDHRPSAQELVDTSVRSGIRFSSVSLAGAGRTLTYGSQDDTGILDEDFAASFAESLGPGAVVDRAVAAIEGGRPVTIDFTTGMVSGRPNARLKASNLLWTTWTILGDLDSGQWAALTRAIRPRQPQRRDDYLPATGSWVAVADSLWGPESDWPTVRRRLRRQSTGREAEYRLAARAGDTRAMLLLGILLEDHGELSEAEIWFRSAIDPTAGEAMVALASLLERHGERDEAEQWFRRARRAIES